MEEHVYEIVSLGISVMAFQNGNDLYLAVHADIVGDGAFQIHKPACLNAF